MLTNLKSLIPFEFMDPSTPSHPLRISESKPRLNLRRKNLALYEPYTLKPHFSCGFVRFALLYHAITHNVHLIQISKNKLLNLVPRVSYLTAQRPWERGCNSFLIINSNIIFWRATFRTFTMLQSWCLFIVEFQGGKLCEKSSRKIASVINNCGTKKWLGEAQRWIFPPRKFLEWI